MDKPKDYGVEYGDDNHEGLKIAERLITERGRDSGSRDPNYTRNHEERRKAGLLMDPTRRRI